MIEHLGSVISDNVIAAMREWIADWQWANLHAVDTDGLTDRQVVRSVARYYVGGVQAFLDHGRMAA